MKMMMDFQRHLGVCLVFAYLMNRIKVNDIKPFGVLHCQIRYPRSVGVWAGIMVSKVEG